MRNCKHPLLIVYANVVLILFLAAFCGCGTEEIIDAVSVEKIGEITFVNTDGTETLLDIDSILELDDITVRAVLTRSTGESFENDYTGIPLAEVLALAGIEEFSSIKFEAADGYLIELDRQKVERENVILAHSKEGEPLDEKEGPLRLIVPDEFGMSWIKLINRVVAE